MKIYSNEQFDGERALYGSRDVKVEKCRFDGPADGESALKESRNIVAKDCFFNLRYPFWHDDHLKIDGCEMTELCRAALWYSEDIEINDSILHGIKALRECGDVKISKCDIVSPEFGWKVRKTEMTDSSVASEYFMMNSCGLTFDNVRLDGKYSFQYIKDSFFTNCEFNTKDAFWHAENVTVKDSVIKGEYLAWYCRNVTFINCTIIGTQPLCYCKGLKLVDCRMEKADLAFEKSEVDAVITTSVDSIKNPKSGIIKVLSVGEIIMDDPEAKGQIQKGF
ncbi:MAG: DUF3737 family protein [Lachnospiraceae bacterium]|nr:DUF3737 family protein [Lachnospiraceae bacterium]